MNRAIVFVNGNLSDVSKVKKIIKKTDFVIAVDGGVKHILKLGLMPNVIIGDMDSIDAELLEKLKKRCREQVYLFPTLIKYPRKKDKTDFELAIDYCLDKKFKELVIFGILGDRIDHMIANIFLISKLQVASSKLQVKIIEGEKELYILNKEIIIDGKIGDEISIIPISQKLDGVTTDGLYYRLIENTLEFGSTRGISNVMTKNKVKISIKIGTALIEHNLI